MTVESSEVGELPQLGVAPAEASEDVIEELGRLDADVSEREEEPSDLEYGVEHYEEVGLERNSEPADILPSLSGGGVPRLRGYTGLEDLCASFDIGELSWLTLDRTRPAAFRGKACKGWLAKIHRPMTMRELKELYGGGTYTVKIQGYSESGAGSKVVTRANIEVVVAGAPLFPDENRTEEKVVNHYPERPPYPAPSPTVEAKRIELEYAARERDEARKDKLVDRAYDRKPGTDLATIEEIADRRSSQVREQMADQAATYREFIRELQEVAKERERLILEMTASHKSEVSSLREEVYTVRTQANATSTNLETARIRELKERHESEYKALKESTSERIERVQTDYRHSKDESDRRHNEERSRLAEDANRRQKDIMDEGLRRDQATRDGYESRLAELHRTSERDLRTIRDLHSGQLLNVQTTGKSEVTMSQTMAVAQERLLQGQVDRLESQVALQAAEIEVLRRDSIKDPLTAIQEARMLVDLTTGGSEVETEVDWKKGLVQLASVGMSKLPEMARELGAARERNSRPHQHQQQARVIDGGYQPQQPQIAGPQRRQRREAFRGPPPGMARSGSLETDVPMGSGYQPAETPPPMASQAGYDPPMSVAPTTSDQPRYDADHPPPPLP